MRLQSDFYSKRNTKLIVFNVFNIFHIKTIRNHKHTWIEIEIADNYFIKDASFKLYSKKKATNNRKLFFQLFLNNIYIFNLNNKTIEILVFFNFIFLVPPQFTWFIQMFLNWTPQLDLFKQPRIVLFHQNSGQWPWH